MRLLTAFLSCIALVSFTARAEDVTIPKARINQAALEKLHVRIGVQAWTFNSRTTFETIDILSRMGVKYLEIFPGQKLSSETGAVGTSHDMSDEHLQLLMKKANASGVKIISYGVVGLPGDEALARKVFEFGKKLGLETIVSEPTPNKETFDVLEKLANEYKINIAMHDHPRPSTYWDPKTVLSVVDGRSARLGACADTGHWRRSGLTPVECVKMLEGRVIEFHLKDINDKKQDVPWGTGTVEAKGIMAELKRQGAKNQAFVVEYESTSGQELIDNVVKCVENFSHDAEELTR